MALIATTRQAGVLRVSAIFLLSLAALLLCPTQRPAQALTFHLSYDSSVPVRAAGFLPAFNDALTFYETTYTDPITINLQVGWGTINNQSLSPGAVGESFVNGQVFSHFAGVKSALINDAKSAMDQTSVANMPSNDPTGNAVYAMSDAEGKALGLLAANAQALDGYVGFSGTAPFTFDPNNRAVAGENDFIGAAEHEISEVMGRYGLGQNGRTSGRYSPIDFFRFTSPGTLDLAPAFGAYFSIDGGTTAINTFNGPNGGDLSDWSGATVDSYNTGTNLGNESLVSTGDINLMDVIGYDVAYPSLPSDYNHDGIVDAADYTVWRDGLGATYTEADYNIWKANFGNHSGAGASAKVAVPEPLSAFLLILGSILASLKGHRITSRVFRGRVIFRNFSVALAVLSLLARSVPPVSAQLTFNVINQGTATPQMMTGFAQAGALWSAFLKDPITVNIRISASALPAGVLGHSEIYYDSYTYTNVRTALVNDRLSADDFSSTNALQAVPSFSMLINRTANNPNGVVSLTPYFDTGLGGPGQAGLENNSTIRSTAANGKALGLLPNDPALLDGTIAFTNSPIYDFDRSDGIAANRIDFVGIAAHEIGHVLGFTSGVDVLVGNGAPPGLNDNQLKFVTPLDLYRFTSRSIGPGGRVGVIDWTGDDTDKYFSVDGGLTPLANFSHGTTYEEGHWQNDVGIGIMDPTAVAGELLKISGMDVRAMDVIGYDLVTAPELAGDFNSNGIVDAADYTVWRDNVGTNNALPNNLMGGTVGIAQYNEWRANFGNHAGSGDSANAAVPEPATRALLIFAAAIWCLQRGLTAFRVSKLIDA